MSLQIWLPLNGNTINQGASGFQPAAADMTYANSGKISANCYTSGEITMPASETAKIFNNKAISIAFWIKPLNTSNSIIFGNDINRQFSLFQYSGSGATKHGTALHWSWQMTLSGGDSWLDDVLPINAWTHVCVTYDNPNFKVYINGELKAKRSGESNVSSFAYDTSIINNGTGRYLADMRVYDHALSALEVKELSKGLAIHYTFDDELLTSYPTLLQNEAGFIQPSGVNNISISSTNNRIGKYSGQFNGMNSYIDTPMIKPDMFTSDYTLNFWVCPLDGGRAVYFGDYNTTGGNFVNIERLADGNFRYWYNGGQNGKDKAVAGLNAEINKWTMLTVSHSTGVLKFYKNGNYIESYTLLEPIAKTSGIMRIGRDGRDATNATASNSTPFNGYMDDFRFYVTQLSDEEILDLYNCGASLSDLGDAHANNFIENATYHGVDEEHNIQANEIYEDILGKDYQQLEYLEATGNQYINTGFIPNNNTHIQITYKSKTNELKALFGARAASNRSVFTAWIQEGNIYTHYGDRDYNAISPISGDTSQKFVYNQNKNIGTVLFNNNVEGSAISNEALFNSGCNLTLLAVNSNGTIDTRRSIGCLYSCQLYDNGTLIRDYYPARRISDGALGLYDVVNDEFYINAGSDSFIAGPTVTVNETSAFTENKNFTSRQIIEI